MPKKIRTILITCALPYANGSIHLGHLLEYIQADIWARYQKLRGHHCYYLCGSDAHGTAIMLQAKKLGISVEILINRIRAEQLADFKRFDIEFDHFSSTHSPTNQALVTSIYQALQQQGDIECRTIDQLFDPVNAIFLPDRFIQGQCPRCNAADQYGDSCEHCGAHYRPTELTNPRSVLSGATPLKKASEHYFFTLSRYSDRLKKWTHDGHIPVEMANKLNEWFTSGLQDWDISRDAPYFGFAIPGTIDKYFYVWLDAPIGYLAACQEFCEAKQLDFQQFWRTDSTTELYHFIGKDIIYFHGLFWPAVLMSAGYRTPTALFVHGMLTVNGQKMSKSRGTFIKATSYLDTLDSAYLRYYYATKLTAQVTDIDLNLDDFHLRINADLIGKVVNIASRCAMFINRYFANNLSTELSDLSLYQAFADAGEPIATLYETLNFARAMRDIMQLADQANHYIDAQKPWQAVKDPSQRQHVQQVCSLGLNLFRLLVIYLQPVLPSLAAKVAVLLHDPLAWDSRYQPLVNTRIEPFKPLLPRIDISQITAMLAASQADLQPCPPN